MYHLPSWLKIDSVPNTYVFLPEVVLLGNRATVHKNMETHKCSGRNLPNLYKYISITITAIVYSPHSQSNNMLYNNLYDNKKDGWRR